MLRRMKRRGQTCRLQEENPLLSSAFLYQSALTQVQSLSFSNPVSRFLKSGNTFKYCNLTREGTLSSGKVETGQTTCSCRQDCPQQHPHTGCRECDPQLWTTLKCEYVTPWSFWPPHRFLTQRSGYYLKLSLMSPCFQRSWWQMTIRRSHLWSYVNLG